MKATSARSTRRVRGLKRELVELRQLLLGAPRLTVSAAESLTCGRVQNLLGYISGSSEYFVGGVTTYTLEQKVRQLGVERSAARRVNCVSAQIARQMAQGACRRFGTDLAAATTGYAEPAPPEGITNPFAWWALAHRRKGRFIMLRDGRIECPGASRAQAQALVAKAVVRELIRYLREYRAQERS